MLGNLAAAATARGERGERGELSDGPRTSSVGSINIGVGNADKERPNDRAGASITIGNAPVPSLSLYKPARKVN